VGSLKSNWLAGLLSATGKHFFVPDWYQKTGHLPEK
jgi:hypothetical protein